MNGTGSSSSSSTPNFDNLLLQSLMSRFQPTRPSLPTPNNYPNPKSLDQLFSDLLLNLSESDSECDDDDNNQYSAYPPKTQLAKEESRLEKEIVKTILTGDIEKLKPNSGQAVTIGEHHICIGYQDENGSEYRVWEWHGHIMLFDEENGYTPEYIYGNYFERVGVEKKGVGKREEKKVKEEEEEEKVVGNVGLKELFESKEKGSGHVLHRILNANCGAV